MWPVKHTPDPLYLIMYLVPHSGSFSASNSTHTWGSIVVFSRINSLSNIPKKTYGDVKIQYGREIVAGPSFACRERRLETAPHWVHLSAKLAPSDVFVLTYDQPWLILKSSIFEVNKSHYAMAVCGVCRTLLRGTDLWPHAMATLPCWNFFAGLCFRSCAYVYTSCMQLAEMQHSCILTSGHGANVPKVAKKQTVAMHG
jgi:hypothetical protein